MHLILKSSKAKGEWSFKHPRNEKKIREIIERFSSKFGIKVHSLANVGNHLHCHIKLSNRFAYTPFIRAVTAAIAMSVTGKSRWSKISTNGTRSKTKFWDYRPFTRIISSYRAFLNLRDYIKINQLEGFGYKRAQARYILAWNKSLMSRVQISDSG